MTTFTLHLQSATQDEKINKVISFAGEDSSGAFGILAQHERMMTCLTYGLANFCYDTNETEYLAIPGGLLYFIDNVLHIITRHYVRCKTYQAMVIAIDQNLQNEEKKLKNIKESIQKLDKEMLKSLLELQHKDLYDI